MKVTDLRPAIAMIELIFAIVIMGIVMMSAPMLISTATKSTSVVLQQEGVNQAVSRVTMILTYPWDEKNTVSSCISPVLGVSNGDSELAMGNDHRRAGVPIGSKSRTFLCGSDEPNATAIGSESGERNDIDDFGNDNLTQIQDAGGRYIGKDHVTIATIITYGDDNASYSNGGTSPIVFTPSSGTATSNIKIIDVNVTTFSSVAELKSTIVMRAFSCNIGGIAYERKVL